MKNISSLIMAKARVKSKTDKHLRGVLCQILDPTLIEHIEFLQVDKNILTLSVKNATWASRLRFFSNEILRITKNASISVSKVQIKISAAESEHDIASTSTSQVVNISSESLSTIYDMTRSLEPSELQKSLQKLVSNAQIKKLKSDD